MGFEPELFEEERRSHRAAFARRAGSVSDREYHRRVLHALHAGINTLEATKAPWPVRLNLPKDWGAVRQRQFPHALGGKCELYSEPRGPRRGDPLPHYVPPHEDPQTKPELAAMKYPLRNC